MGSYQVVDQQPELFALAGTSTIVRGRRIRGIDYRNTMIPATFEAVDGTAQSGWPLNLQRASRVELNGPTCPRCWGSHGCDLPEGHDGDHACLIEAADEHDPTVEVCCTARQDDPRLFDVPARA